jgi:hypothetical protein
MAMRSLTPARKYHRLGSILRQAVAPPRSRLGLALIPLFGSFYISWSFLVFQDVPTDRARSLRTRARALLNMVSSHSA